MNAGRRWRPAQKRRSSKAYTTGILNAWLAGEAAAIAGDRRPCPYRAPAFMQAWGQGFDSVARAGASRHAVAPEARV